MEINGDRATHLIARQPSSPNPPILATLTEPQAQLLEAIRECLAAEKALNAAVGLPPDQYDAADERFTEALARVTRLSAQLPSPYSWTDIVLLAQAAYCAVEKEDDGSIQAEDNVELASARLIEAVLEFAGVMRQ